MYKNYVPKWWRNKRMIEKYINEEMKKYKNV